MRPKSASSQRAKAEAAHRKVMARREAESTVRASYFRFAGSSDVPSFMRALGYDMPASAGASLPALFHAAVQVRSTSLSDSWPSEVLLKDLTNSRTLHQSWWHTVTKRLLCWICWRFLVKCDEEGTECDDFADCQRCCRHFSMLDVIHNHSAH